MNYAGLAGGVICMALVKVLGWALLIPCAYWLVWNLLIGQMDNRLRLADRTIGGFGVSDSSSETFRIIAAVELGHLSWGLQGLVSYLFITTLEFQLGALNYVEFAFYLVLFITFCLRPSWWSILLIGAYHMYCVIHIPHLMDQLSEYSPITREAFKKGYTTHIIFHGLAAGLLAWYGFQRFKLGQRPYSQTPIQQPESISPSKNTFASNEKLSIEKNDEAIDLARYKQAASEVETGNRDDALWYKAFAEGGGDENATKAAYIRLRVEQLRRAAVAASAVRVTATQPSPVYTPAPPTPAKPKPNGANTLYDILGIARKATDEEILAGYQTQKSILDARENQDAETRNRLIFLQHAKEVLLDPIKRAAYDARI